MYMWECGVPEPSNIWLLPYRQVPCGMWNSSGTIPSVYMSSPNVITAGAVTNLSVCGLTTARKFNEGAQDLVSYIWCKTRHHGRSVEAHFQHGAGCMCLFFLIIKAANTSNNDNNVPNWISYNQQYDIWMRPLIHKPTNQNGMWELTGLANHVIHRRLMGTGTGSAQQEAMCWVVGHVWCWT